MWWPPSSLDTQFHSLKCTAHNMRICTAHAWHIIQLKYFRRKTWPCTWAPTSKCWLRITHTEEILNDYWKKRFCNDFIKWMNCCNFRYYILLAELIIFFKLKWSFCRSLIEVCKLFYIFWRLPVHNMYISTLFILYLNTWFSCLKDIYHTHLHNNRFQLM